MKHTMWSLVLGFVALCGMAGCGDDLVDDGEYYYVHNMNEFTITGQLTIYYTDVSGRDLVSLEDTATWPVAAASILSDDSLSKYRSGAVRVDTLGSTLWMYGKGCNNITWSEKDRLCAFRPLVWGNGTGKDTTYVHVAGQVDRIVTTYFYKRGNDIWFPYKSSIEYNGVPVWKTNDPWNEVFVTRTEKGTEVKAVVLDK